MSGAYVAKPAVAPTPDPPIEPKPPDWDDYGDDDYSWPFDGGESGLPGSGAYPPGYTPAFTLIMTATEEIAPDGAASVTGSLRDHGTFATREPDAITWTAAIDGEAVDLKFTGESFASSISSDCAFATYWGAAPSIEFDLTDDNDGDTVVLTGMSVVDGVTVTQTAETTVVNEILADFDCAITYSGTPPFWGATFTFNTSASPYDAEAVLETLWERSFGFAPPNTKYWVDGETRTYPYISGRNDMYESTIQESGTSVNALANLIEDDEFLRVTLTLSLFSATATVEVTLVILGETYTKTLAANHGPTEWLRITRDGTVTIINP